MWSPLFPVEGLVPSWHNSRSREIPGDRCAKLTHSLVSWLSKSRTTMSYSRVAAPRTSKTQRGRGSSSAAGGYQPRLVSRPTVDQGRPPFNDCGGELVGTSADSTGGSSAASLEPRSLQRYGRYSSHICMCTRRLLAFCDSNKLEEIYCYPYLLLLLSITVVCVFNCETQTWHTACAYFSHGHYHVLPPNPHKNTKLKRSKFCGWGLLGELLIVSALSTWLCICSCWAWEDRVWETQGQQEAANSWTTAACLSTTYACWWVSQSHRNKNQLVIVFFVCMTTFFIHTQLW